MAAKHERKLTRTGRYGYYALIPPDIIRDLKWRERQKVTVRKVGNRIVIEDWNKETKKK